MKSVLDYIKAVTNQTAVPAAVADKQGICQSCNYRNNYYGDQVCVVLDGKRLV